MKWVYGWYSREPVPKNLCSYFWKLLLSPIPLLLVLFMYVFSLYVSLILAFVWWIAGYRPNFNFADLRRSNPHSSGPINEFECGYYKEGLYTKNERIESRVAPWEILLILGTINFMFTMINLSLTILAIGIGIWLLVLGIMRSGKLVGPFIQSIKEKHCKKLEFVD